MTSRKDWSPEDYQNRFKELRASLAELSEKEISDADYNSKTKALFREREILDNEYRAYRAENDVDTRTAGFQTASVNESVAPDYRTAGELVLSDESMAAWLKGGARGTSPKVELRGAGYINSHRSGWEQDYEYRALLDDSASGSTTGLLLPVQQPTLPGQTVVRKRLFLRDLLGQGSTNSNSVPFIMELNATTNESSASTVKPGEAKPEALMEFSEYDAPVRTIAVWVPITEQTYEDNRVLVSYINGRLSYMLAVREEQQLLSGNGINPDLKGIRTYSEVQTQAATSGDHAVTIANAINKVWLVDGDPDAVVMHPTDYTAYITKRSTSSFDFGGGGNAPYGDTPRTAWGLPVVVSKGLGSAGTALVGNFRLGAQIFDRHRVRIDMTDSHSDYFIKNKRVIRAEERLALAVHRPDWFVVATLA